MPAPAVHRRHRALALHPASADEANTRAGLRRVGASPAEARESDLFGIGIQELWSKDIGHDFLDRAARLVERGLRQADGSRIGVGNRDASVPPAPDHPRQLFVGPVGIVERVLPSGVAVRPAIDIDRFDGSRRAELPVRPCATQLIADLAFERLERGLQLRSPSVEPAEADSCQKNDWQAPTREACQCNGEVAVKASATPRRVQPCATRS